MKRSNSAIFGSGLLIAGALLAIVSLAPTVPIFGQLSDNTPTGSASSGTTTSSTLNFNSPLLVENAKVTNVTAINGNTTRVSITGNGTFTLSNGNKVITSVSELDIRYSLHGFSKTFGYVFFQTTNGKENASALYVEFKPDNSNIGTGTAYFQTNSTGQLAELNNSVATFRDQQGSPTNTVTFWKWS